MFGSHIDDYSFFGCKSTCEPFTTEEGSTCIHLSLRVTDQFCCSGTYSTQLHTSVYVLVRLWKYIHTYRKRMYLGYISKKVLNYIILYTLFCTHRHTMSLYIIIHVTQLLYVCAFSLLHHIYPQDKLTVVKLSVIIILISVAALNITLVGAVAMAWKYCEHSQPAIFSVCLQCSLSFSIHFQLVTLFLGKRQRTKLASARVAQQGASIAMNTNTTCMANSGQYDYFKKSTHAVILILICRQ